MAMIEFKKFNYSHLVITITIGRGQVMMHGIFICVVGIVADQLAKSSWWGVVRPGI